LLQASQPQVKETTMATSTPKPRRAAATATKGTPKTKVAQPKVATPPKSRTAREVVDQDLVAQAVALRTPDGNGGSFEVWNHRKGDMARAVMYMAIRYEGGTDAATGQSEPDLELTDDRSKIVQTSSSPAYMGLLSTLVAWSQQDPPDAAERARNEVIYSFQGNRNPFIDHPEWATSGLFTSAKPASCQLLD